MLEPVYTKAVIVQIEFSKGRDDFSPLNAFDEFKELYFNAWKQGCKGITTFRADGKRYGILNEVKEEPKVEACFIDPATGQKECE